MLNVGAGTGSYEPSGPAVVAVDPSAPMLSRRPSGAGPAVRAVAESLPFPDRSFDAVMAILTVHHWDDRGAGYAELRRVAPRRVVVTYEPAVHNRLWMVADYVPEVARLDDLRPDFCAAEVARGIGASEVRSVPVPWDCTDGFLMAYWRRPEALLDPAVRRATSGLSLADPAAVTEAMERLRADLGSGRWDRRYGHLRRLETLDVGLRLVIASA